MVLVFLFWVPLLLVFQAIADLKEGNKGDKTKLKCKCWFFFIFLFLTWHGRCDLKKKKVFTQKISENTAAWKFKCDVAVPVENLEKTGTEEGEHLAFNCLYKVVMWYARYVLCNIIVLDTSFHRFPSFFFILRRLGVWRAASDGCLLFHSVIFYLRACILWRWWIKSVQKVRFHCSRRLP